MIAPSGPMTPERIERGIAQLAGWGFEVRAGKHLHDHHGTLPYLAGRDEDRAADLMDAWTDPDVAAIWCARGGYGAQRMVDLLDFDALRAAGPKHLIGFSDITALHARFGRELEQITVHGPVGTGTQLADPPSADCIQKLILDRPRSGQTLITGEPLVPGRAEGRLIGGNLALIVNDLGIEPAPAEPSIVIMEDVGEESYRLDRMLTQLRRVNWFERVTGIVLGDFTEGDDPEQIATVLAERLDDLGVPILHRAPFGHADRNLALPLGTVVTLDTDRGLLTLS